MSEPYVFIEGDPDHDHGGAVEKSILLTYPPIEQWRCQSCGRVVRRRVAPVRQVMPEVKDG